MSKENMYINVSGNELTIREGQALPLQEPKSVTIYGIISTISIWLRYRVSELIQKSCHIIVDRYKMTIQLVINEIDEYGHLIVGSLQLSDEYKEFQINSGRKWSTFDLSDFFKMHRSFFESQDKAMKLVSELRSFKAKVDKKIENSKDDRANYSLVRTQAVESNLPENFNLIIPIFKGMKAETLIIEINIDPNSLECSLCSPQANDIIETTKNSIIDVEIEKIREIAPEIVIVEV